MFYMESYLSEITDILPIEIRTKKGFRTRRENITALHFPKSEADFLRARSELAYEELFMIQFRGMERKKEEQARTEGKAKAIPINAELMKSMISGLPYELTSKQKIVLFQILRDMERSHTMARLLQGDVGTGKTIVAFLAAIHAMQEANIQVAIMAPTEILARQLFDGWNRQF